LLEDEYFVLHASSNATEIRAAAPKIQVNLVRILRFVSREPADAHPGSHLPGSNTL